MKHRKILALVMAAAMCLGLLAACGGDTAQTPASNAPASQEPNTPASQEPTDAPEAAWDGQALTVNLASEPQSIDPALNSAVDGGIMLTHFFEGLIKWENSGVETEGSDGTAMNATPAAGQAESWEKTANEDGTVTWTFKLRPEAKWSDGQQVVAGDFVYAWQRLVDPATASDYNYMIDCVVNAVEIMNGEKDPSELAVSAPDDATFVVTLTNEIPYFEEICAFPATFPVRKDIVDAHGEQWTFEPDTYICNGPYKMDHWTHNSEIVAVPNEEYYDVASIGPKTLTFKLMDDDNAMLSGFKSGELDFIEQVPQAELAGLIASGDMKILSYVGTYYVCYQTQRAPFDDPRVRQAFTLAVDRNFIVNNVSQSGEVVATGFVPAGIYDAEGASGADFRTVGGDFYETAEDQYQANCDLARDLLTEAGFPNGEGFPVVEYLYNTADNHKAIGEALANMWETELGVTVQLNNQEWATFLQTRKDGDYSIARNGWIADYIDPMSFLDMWMTGGGNNDAQYANAEYDEVIRAAKLEADPAKRMELMHQAEDILMKQDWVLNPIYFYTNKYMLKDGVDNMLYTPKGYFIFTYCTPEA